MLDCRLGALAAQNESLNTTISERDASIRQQQDTLEKYESKLQEAKTVLSDKQQLEESAMKQLEVINRQADELASLKEALAERDAALAASQSENAVLQLKASTTKQHCIFFDEPWIVENTHHKLRGTVPSDREGHYLVALQGLLHLLMHESIFTKPVTVPSCGFLCPERWVSWPVFNSRFAGVCMRHSSQ
jgi:TolA-binding protein